MPLEEERLHRAPLISLYKNTGLFAWSEGLRLRGARSPVRTVFIIDHCLRRPSMGLVRAAFSHDALPAVLTRALAQYGDAPVCMDEAAVPEPLLDAAGWDAYSALAELLAQQLEPELLGSVRHRLRLKGLKVGADEISDLAALFANMHLRPALSSFDPQRGEGHEAAWLSTVFYRYALRQVLATRHTVALADWLEIDDLPAEHADPPAVLEQRLQEAATVRLQDWLARLPRPQCDALTLYFGFRGREHTVAEVAHALGINAYFARTALVSGLGALAATSGAEGLLEPDERALAQALFVDGISIEGLAREQRVELSQMRKAASAITLKLQSVLRRRTRLPRIDSPSRSRATATMTKSSSEFLAALSTQDVRAWQSEASGPEAPAVAPRRRAAEPVASEQPRTDLPPGYADWLRELDAAAARCLADMAPWLDKLREQAQATGLNLAQAEPTLTDDEAWQQALHDGAVATTAALEALLPRAARRAPDLRLVVHGLLPQGGDVTAHLETEGWRSDTVPLLTLLAHRLGFAAGLSAGTAQAAARAGLGVMAEQASPLLPGFAWLPAAHPRRGELTLRWVNPVRQAATAAEPGPTL